MSSRNLTPEEKDGFPGDEPVMTVIGKDLVIPMVSDEVKEAGVKSIRMKELRKIF